MVGDQCAIAYSSAGSREFERWRREKNSNPRRLAAKWFSRSLVIAEAFPIHDVVEGAAPTWQGRVRR
jgi:hypothetical protein